MSSRLLVVFLAALLPSGCTLPELRELGCGDSVLGEGEDCDGRYVMEGGTCGAVGTPNECLYVCAESADCPEGWRCGIDDRCYQPQPKFVELTPREPLPGFVGAVSDVDGDGLGDIAGSDGISLSVSFGGDADGQPSDFGLDLSGQSGEPWFGRLDGDPAADVVLPLERALLAFSGAPTREYVPRLYSSAREPVQAAAGALLEADGDIVSEILFLTETADGSSMRFRDVACEPVPLPDGRQVSELVSPLYASIVQPEKRIPRVDLDGDGITEFALGFARSPALYLYTSAGSADSDDPATCLRPVPYEPAPEIPLPEGYVLADSNLLFADIDADTDIDVLMALSLDLGEPPLGMRLPVIADSIWIARGTGGGAFEPTPTELPEILPALFQDFNGMLAAGDFDDNGLADYVTGTGIYLTMPPQAGEALPQLVPVAAPRNGQWSEAVVVDLDGDGSLDVIASSSLHRGLDWLVNAASAGLPGRFNRHVVDTAFPTAYLTTGDFDGDFAIDVAMIELDPDAPEDDLTLVLSIGSGLPGLAQPNGKVSKTIWMLDAGVLPDLSDRGVGEIDGIDDLVLLSSMEPFDPSAPRTQEARFYDLLGSTSQKLFSPLYVFDAADEIDGPRLAQITAAGHFTGGPVLNGASRHRDVVVASIPVSVAEGHSEEIDASLALLASTADGDLQRAAVGGEVIEQLSGYIPSCMYWLTGDVDGAAAAGGVEELVVVEGGLQCDRQEGGPALSVWMIDFSAPAGQAVRRIELPPEYVDISRALLVDLDVDGGQDLVLVAVSQSENQGVTAPISEVLILWNDGACATPPFCTQSSFTLPAHDLREDSVAPWPSPVDVTPMQLDGDTHLELAVLYARRYALEANERAAVVTFGSDVEAPREYRELIVDTDHDGELDPAIDLGTRDIRSITAGDLNGDGLDDLVLDETSVTRVHLQVPAEPLGTTLRREEARQ